MIRPFAWAALLSLLAAAAQANEALLEESSGAPAAVGGDTPVRMVSERVVIELGREQYTVDASFEFRNEGGTVTVPVGFPDVGYGYAGTFTGLRDNETFETWVNGEPCPFRIAPGRMVLHSGDGQERVISDPDSLAAARAVLQRGGKPAFADVDASLACEETRWYVKEVTFPGGATTTTRVRYVAGYTSYLEYTYGTGNTWSGSIDRAVFVVKTSPEVWMQAAPQLTRRSWAWTNTRTYEKKRPGEFEHEYVLTDVEPFEDEVIRVFIRDRSPKKPEQPWERGGNFAFADRPVPDEFLDLLSLAQLRLFLNAFYAYHGKVFADRALDAHFRDTYWYQPSADFRDEDLSDTDRASIHSILAKEQWLLVLTGAD